MILRLQIKYFNVNHIYQDKQIHFSVRIKPN